jgi:hypothetical protein
MYSSDKRANDKYIDYSGSVGRSTNGGRAAKKASLRKCSGSKYKSVSSAQRGKSSENKTPGTRGSSRGIVSRSKRAAEWETILVEDIFGKTESEDGFLLEVPPLTLTSFSYVYSDDDDEVATIEEGSLPGRKSKAQKVGSTSNDPFTNAGHGTKGSAHKNSREGAMPDDFF